MLLCSLVIALDQFLAIVTPLHYHSIVDHTRLLWLCLTVWALALLLPLLSLTPPLPPLLPSPHCPPPHDPPPSTTALSISLAVLLLLLPYLSIVVMHLIIFNSARTNSVRIRRNSTSSNTGSMCREVQYLQGENNFFLYILPEGIFQTVRRDNQLKLQL